MLSLEEAQSRILSAVPYLGAETVLLSDCLHRYAAENLKAPINIPPFDNSAMDGYAVRSSDLQKSPANNPLILSLSGKIPAGGDAASTLDDNCCVRIFTGSPLPPGADAVVMQEDVTVEGDQISFKEPPAPFENVRLKGEDVRESALILKQGDRINATRKAVLASCGFAALPAGRQPQVELVATGNELREPGHALGPGEIYESNRPLLAGLLKEIAHLKIPPPVPDTLDKTTALFEQSFSRSDLVISTGGVSVGEFDFVKDAFARLGGKIDLWKISIRPGKPFVFGKLGEKFLFGLPGNPVSALVTFLLLVRPALLKMAGAAHCHLPDAEGELNEPLLNDGDRRHFMRVRWEQGKIYRSGPQASHMIGSLGTANGLLDVPPRTRMEQGQRARVLLWELPEK